MACAHFQLNVHRIWGAFDRGQNADGGLGDFAVGETRPNLTLLLVVPHEMSRERLSARQFTLPFMRDRMEEADRSFFERVARGYQAIAITEASRVRVIDGTGSVPAIERAIWKAVEPLLG